MLYFNNDYSEGCHEKVLEALVKTNYEQTPGYGEDAYCARAAEKIRAACEDESLAVHFLVGGTQANATVIASALRPYQGVLCASTGHIHVHETGAVEGTGHKCLPLPATDGKISAEQIQEAILAQRNDGSFEHIVQPGMVYISQSTEMGTLYSLQELTAISQVCRELGVYLFVDGARLGYALAARSNNITLPQLAALSDVFYLGGTKVGALFGEAVVIRSGALKRDFRYMIKRQGGMLAKGRLLGVQFDTLMTDGLYFRISAHADTLAERIRDTLLELDVPFLAPPVTNQLFPILPDAVLEKLGKEYVFGEQQRVDETHRAVRFCTSWATKPEAVDALCDALRELCTKEV